jgi:hypothetical protein
MTGVLILDVLVGQVRKILHKFHMRIVASEILIRQSYIFPPCISL